MRMFYFEVVLCQAADVHVIIILRFLISHVFNVRIRAGHILSNRNRNVLIRVPLVVHIKFIIDK